MSVTLSPRNEIHRATEASKGVGKESDGAREGHVPIVYVVRREGLSSVFASQVARRMGAVAETGRRVDVGVFTPLGQWVRGGQRRRWRETVESLPRALGGRVWRLPSLPSRFDRPMLEARVLTGWLRWRYGTSGRVIVQCRNATVTRMALRAKRSIAGVRVIFDFRGVVDHEHLYNRGFTYADAPAELRAEAERLGAEQREAAERADGITCVSEAMVDYLAAEYGIPREKCVVVPCCVDVERFCAATERREEMRERLGLSGRFVVCYCGSLAAYQLPRESLRLFQQIRGLRGDAHFLAVTTAPEAMREAARDVGVGEEQMTVVSVGADEVPAYLSAADVGLLLRERSPVNEVASPVKFGEYLGSGTPVILSEGIGDYSELARRERVGVVIPWKADGTRSVPTTSSSGETVAMLRGFLSEYEAAPREWRERCLEVARRELDFEVHLPKMIELYGRLSVEG